MALGGTTFQDYHLIKLRERLEDELQRKGSRLMPTVEVIDIDGRTTEFTKIGAMTEYEQTSINMVKQYQDETFEKRHINHITITSDILLDEMKMADFVANPSGDYVEKMRWAIGRRVDTEIAKVLKGSVDVITDGSTTSTALPSDSKIAVDLHTYDTANGSNDISLTEFKLKKAIQLLEAKNVEIDMEDVFCISNSNQFSALRMVQEVVNHDFGGQGLREKSPGAIGKYLGLNFVNMGNNDILGFITGTVESAYVYPRSAIRLGLVEPIKVEILKDVSRVKNPWSISVSMVFGVTRMYEEKVIQIACHPSNFVSA